MAKLLNELKSDENYSSDEDEKTYRDSRPWNKEFQHWWNTEEVVLLETGIVEW
jgi:hypothetical protein